MRLQERSDLAITTVRLEFAWCCLEMAKRIMNEENVMIDKTRGDFHGIFSLLQEYVNNEEKCQ